MKINILHGKEIFTDGLPKDKIEEVIEEVKYKNCLLYYSCSGRHLHNTNKEFCDFLIFKDGEIFGYQAGKWIKLEKPKQVFIFR
jgi:hypothetical protein